MILTYDIPESERGKYQSTTGIDSESLIFQKYCKLADIHEEEDISVLAQRILHYSHSFGAITGEQEDDTLRTIFECCLVWDINAGQLYEKITGLKSYENKRQFIAFLDIKFFGSEQSELACAGCGCLADFSETGQTSTSTEPPESAVLGMADCKVCGWADTLILIG